MPRVHRELPAARALSRAFARACVAVALAATALAHGAPEEVRELERLFRSGGTELALERVDRAIRARPQDADLQFAKGVMLSELKRTPEAIAVFETLTQSFPDLPEPYNNLAVLHAGEGHIDRARELLETALRHDPGYLTARENLGDVYVRLALRAYERVSAGRDADATLERKLRLARDLLGTSR